MSLAPLVKEDDLKEYYYAVTYIDQKANKKRLLGEYYRDGCIMSRDVCKQ